MAKPARELPPGQHAAPLERFGLPQFARRRVEPPTRPVVVIGGEVLRPTAIEAADLFDGLPRHEIRADLHCVTTFSALDLAWSGVRLRDVLRRAAELVGPHPDATWLLARGMDGFESSVALADVQGDDVLLADRLDGEPLSADTGTPLRLVTPRQYGYKNVKHVVLLEYQRKYASGSAGWKGHPRARVDREERSRFLPGPVWRRLWAAALPLARRPYRGEPGPSHARSGGDA